MPPILLLDIPEFVTCHGGQYYFMPGRRALALLGAPAAKDTRGANGSLPARTGGFGVMISGDILVNLRKWLAERGPKGVADWFAEGV